MEQLNWQQFTTASIARPQRYRMWNEICSETLCRMTIDPDDREGFNSSLARAQYGSLGIARMRTSASRTSGCGESTSGWVSAEKDCILLVLREAGHGVFEQHRGQFLVGPGDLFLHDLNQPATFACDEDVEQIMLKIPFSSLLSRIADPSELLGTVLSGKAPRVALAADIIRSINQNLDKAHDSDWDLEVEDVTLDAIAMLYKAPGSYSLGAVDRKDRTELRRKAKTYILHHLTDPELNVSQVAAALRVSNRHLQRTFAEVGELTSRFILYQRLELAARQLASLGDDTHGSIFEVALMAGFNDPSHFGRAFSRRFGVSPRDFRNVRARVS